jgi:epoxyqueuosine reductase
MTVAAHSVASLDFAARAALKERIKAHAIELGFQQLGVSDLDLSASEKYLDEWIARGFAGSMDYLHKHGRKRTRPAQLVPNTVSVLSVRMDYFPPSPDVSNVGDHAPDRGHLLEHAQTQLDNPELAYVSRYALGRDYHKVLRNRLQKLCDQISAWIGPFGYRVFVDSAPVMEKPIAQKAGLGWIGKHTNLINRSGGSWFFLGEVYLDLALPADIAEPEHCGTCTRCISACPTGAIIAPFELDARLCISYLTIELEGSIPEPLRAPMGNRIYGCDDCQLVCPWNKFAKLSAEPDFRARHRLDQASLLELFAWTEQDFLARTEGSAIRRIGHHRWQRNIAVALGNGPANSATIAALQGKLTFVSDLIIREHIEWALKTLLARQIS